MTAIPQTAGARKGRVRGGAAGGRATRRAAVAALALLPALVLGSTASYGACIDAFMADLDEFRSGSRTPRSAFGLNEGLVLCFRAAKSGYVSIFDAPAKGDFEQLYPNRITHPDGATYAPVEAGVEYCFGTEETFPLYHAEIDGSGQGKVSIALTSEPEQQLSGDDYAIPGQRVLNATMNAHLRSHSEGGDTCAARDVRYLDYTVSE